MASLKWLPFVVSLSNHAPNRKIPFVKSPFMKSPFVVSLSNHRPHQKFPFVKSPFVVSLSNHRPMQMTSMITGCATRWRWPIAPSVMMTRSRLAR